MVSLSSIRQRLRQRRFPPEFRIPEPLPPAETPEKPVPEAEPVEPPDLRSDMDDATVAHLATNLWRVLKRFTADGNGEAPKAQRMATRNLSAMSERLAKVGVRVQDHDGCPFDPGMSLKVLAYEPRPNLEKEVVVETERPSIYRGKQCIQIGHVIVGVPEKGQDDGPRDD